MKREQPKSGRKLLYIIMVLLGLVAGCIAAPELTPEEVTQINVLCKDDATCIIEQTDDAMRRLLERLEYEREDRATQRLDKMVIFLNACDQSDSRVVVEVIRGGRSQLPNAREKRIARREYGYAYTHENLGRSISTATILCMNPHDLFQQLRY